jgi:hypothetical protein
MDDISTQSQPRDASTSIPNHRLHQVMEPIDVSLSKQFIAVFKTMRRVIITVLKKLLRNVFSILIDYTTANHSRDYLMNVTFPASADGNEKKEQGNHSK